ncbi:uncharacterized protein [Diabrotica undecimpunctata]|uniref:uncharacterized protein n=1 Tax=Diabrotica undecimpunctata TaxID=50387 RepID=UPI003B63397E
MSGYPLICMRDALIIEKGYIDENDELEFNIQRCSTPKPEEEIPSLENDTSSYKRFYNKLQTKISSYRVRGVTVRPHTILSGHLVGPKSPIEENKSVTEKFFIIEDGRSNEPDVRTLHIWDNIIATLKRLQVNVDKSFEK